MFLRFSTQTHKVLTNDNIILRNPDFVKSAAKKIYEFFVNCSRRGKKSAKPAQKCQQQKPSDFHFVWIYYTDKSEFEGFFLRTFLARKVLKLSKETLKKGLH